MPVVTHWITTVLCISLVDDLYLKNILNSEQSQSQNTSGLWANWRKMLFIFIWCLVLFLIFFFTARMPCAVSSPACRSGSVASGGGSKWILSFSADSKVKHQNFSCPDSFPCWQEMGALQKWCLHGVEAESCLVPLYHDPSDWHGGHQETWKSHILGRGWQWWCGMLRGWHWRQGLAFVAHSALTVF